MCTNAATMGMVKALTHRVRQIFMLWCAALQLLLPVLLLGVQHLVPATKHGSVACLGMPRLVVLGCH
jgi:hypothetical protein